jgi:hypothetical protein
MAPRCACQFGLWGSGHSGRLHMPGFLPMPNFLAASGIVVVRQVLSDDCIVFFSNYTF